MIPVKLELTNFFSYRDTAVLDFDGIHLAGISGANGAGKSTIMEAMTWSLFGQSRVRSDDDLVNRQADDDGAAEVRFTFSLEDIVYRVIRRKRLGKTMILELQMDAGDGLWKTLSEGRMRETQEAIEALLQMNYDTFTNASFLLQGKADQFTTRTASQRKEILAELLGVTQWEQYRERAAAARKVIEGSIALLDARLEEIASELEEESARAEAVENAKAERLTIVEKRELKELLLTEARVKEEARKQLQKSIGETEERIERLQKIVANAQATLQTRQEERERLAETIAHADEILAEFAAWETADKALETFQAQAQRHNELMQAMQPLKVQLAQAQSRLEQQKAALLDQKSSVANWETERGTLAASIGRSEEKLDGLLEESKQMARLQEDLHKARELLQQTKGTRDLWQQELAELEGQAAAMEALALEKTAAKNNIEEAEALFASLSEQLAIISEQRETYAKLQAELAALKGQQPSLRSEMDTLKERIETLETAEADGACPLCEQPLSEEHRHTVLETLRAEGKFRGDNFRKNDARMKSLEVELPQVDKTIRQAQPLDRERQAQQKRLSQAEARLQEIERAETAWSAGGEKRLVTLAASLADETEYRQYAARVETLEASLRSGTELQETLRALQKQAADDNARLLEIERQLREWETTGKGRLGEIETQLAAGDFEAHVREELDRLQGKLEKTAYDAAAHQRAISQRQIVAGAPDRHQRLREAQAAMAPLANAIEDLEIQIGEQTNDLEKQTGQQADAKKQLANLMAGGMDLTALETEVFQLREDAIAADRKIGAAQQKLDVLNDLREFRKELLAQKATSSLRVQRLTVLEKSCGRKGVQALLIEHALPEIEESANELLDRLSGGEMRIKFDTQRQLKSRDALAETLDIIISDRAGERPYDNYSGGEQFRINFAIRLALSQLLANRSGARLQTLVVDEGFGSQDPQGRQRLIEAINAIQDDFACILVITHIDELREAFPTRIEVQKSFSGSTIRVE